MFEGIREKIYNLHENLTTSIRSLSVADPLHRRSLDKQNTPVNLNAGADILDRFQTSWAELNEASQENASRAQEVDEIIFTLHKNAEKKWKDIAHMNNVLMSLPEVINTLNELSVKIVTLEELFDNVEKGLIQLEDIIDTREFQNQQLEHRFQLALHNEKKLTMLENMRINLAENIDEKLRVYEEKQKRLLKECHEASAENFKQDLKYYKETNTVPKIEFAKVSDVSTNKASDTALEDVILDNEDSAELQNFYDDPGELSEK